MFIQKNKSCLICVDRCLSKALTEKSYDRFKCYEVCLKSFDKYQELYVHNKSKKGKPRGGSEVCGKFMVNLPCSFNRP